MPESAVERLERAYAGKAGEATATGPRIGLFGDGLPEALIRAAGATPLDVKAANKVVPDPRITPYLEPFMDKSAADVLHRLARGAFDGFAGLIFSRDDSAGLTAYQYAFELRRIGVLPDGPPLHLWNLVHTDSAPAHRFNMTEAARLDAFLTRACGHGFAKGLPDASAAESARDAALSRMDEAGLPPRDAHVWRNAGRWLAPETHAALLEEALQTAPPAPTGPAIGLVGSAIADPALYAMLGRIGPLKADLQPYGQPWPAIHAADGPIDDVIRTIAAYPLHVRAAPAGRFRSALLDRLKACDVVIALLAPHEESLGWDLPALHRDLSRHNVPLVDLGFLPDDMDANWQDQAFARIRAAVEVPA
ncbi:hypothetical protein HKCCE4037_02905 [Rhodobacterales bacterium HKCCE4037]|nr:hypothetical protein [Rhodobacterales bacterium HKCCE4037]